MVNWVRFQSVPEYAQQIAIFLKKKYELQKKEPESFLRFGKSEKRKSEKPITTGNFLHSTSFFSPAASRKIVHIPYARKDHLQMNSHGSLMDQLLTSCCRFYKTFGDPSCQNTCSGNFLRPEQVLETSETPMVKPPSVILKEFFSSLQGSTPTEAMVHQKTLLPVAEVELWLEHLKTVETNCKRGATSTCKEAERNNTKPGSSRLQVWSVPRRGVMGGM